MFGVGFFELVVIAIVALVFVGPKKLPDVMRQAGRFFVQIRRTANDVRSTFDQVIRDAEDEIRREEAAAMREMLTGGKEREKPVHPTTGALPLLHDPHHIEAKNATTDATHAAVTSEDLPVGHGGSNPPATHHHTAPDAKKDS